MPARLAIMAALAAFPSMLERDRKRCDPRVCRAAWLLCVSVRQYHELEAGERLPDFETVDRIDRFFGWPRSFARTDRSGR
jgi:hypothetical protein